MQNNKSGSKLENTEGLKPSFENITQEEIVRGFFEEAAVMAGYSREETAAKWEEYLALKRI